MPFSCQPEVKIEEPDVVPFEQMGELAYVAIADIAHQFNVGG
jgi:hypothetical protein